MLKLKWVLVFFLSTPFCLSVQAQVKKFPAPPAADTITNPLKGDAAAVADGKKIYTQYCVACHGEKGKGDGVASPGLSKPPADHSSAFIQKQTDGALFWIITAGNNPMPPYKNVLTPAQRWATVNYIRTLAKKSK